MPKFIRERDNSRSQFIIIEPASKSPLLCLVLIHCVCGSTAVQCSLSAHSSDVRMNCTHPISTNSYSSTCVFNCDEGFKLIGSNKSQCDHTGQWIPKTPTCKGTKSSIAIYSNSFALYRIFFPVRLRMPGTAAVPAKTTHMKLSLFLDSTFP